MTDLKIMTAGTFETRLDKSVAKSCPSSAVFSTPATAKNSPANVGHGIPAQSQHDLQHKRRENQADRIVHEQSGKGAGD